MSPESVSKTKTETSIAASRKISPHKKSKKLRAIKQCASAMTPAKNTPHTSNSAFDFPPLIMGWGSDADLELTNQREKQKQKLQKKRKAVASTDHRAITKKTVDPIVEVCEDLPRKNYKSENLIISCSTSSANSDDFANSDRNETELASVSPGW